MFNSGNTVCSGPSKWKSAFFFGPKCTFLSKTAFIYFPNCSWSFVRCSVHVKLSITFIKNVITFSTSADVTKTVRVGKIIFANNIKAHLTQFQQIPMDAVKSRPA